MHNINKPESSASKRPDHARGDEQYLLARLRGVNAGARNRSWIVLGGLVIGSVLVVAVLAAFWNGLGSSF